MNVVGPVQAGRNFRRAKAGCHGQGVCPKERKSIDAFGAEAASTAAPNEVGSDAAVRFTAAPKTMTDTLRWVQPVRRKPEAG